MSLVIRMNAVGADVRAYPIMGWAGDGVHIGEVDTTEISKLVYQISVLRIYFETIGFTVRYATWQQCGQNDTGGIHVWTVPHVQELIPHSVARLGNFFISAGIVCPHMNEYHIGLVRCRTFKVVPTLADNSPWSAFALLLFIISCRNKIQ